MIDKGKAGRLVGETIRDIGILIVVFGPLDSLFPAGIPIGQVSNANQNTLINNGQVQVSPAADLRHFDFVQILTKPQATTQRAQVP